jgi:carbon monoxide dehydrogenase subunit G
MSPSRMPTLSESVTIPAAVDDVWPLLRDPALVASCIPGATLAPEQEDGAWKGSIRVKFGPTVAEFRGEATLAYDDAAKRCTITGRGIDKRGASRALANGVVSAAADGAGTKLTVDGEYSVTGPLETFANAGGVHVARALLAEFSKNMAAVVAERGGAGASGPAAVTPGTPPAAKSPTVESVESPASPAAPSSPAAPPTATSQTDGASSEALPARVVRPPMIPIDRPRPAAAELSAVKLMWGAFLSWIASIFRKGSK